MLLEDKLKELGWSNELIRAVESVSSEIERSAVASNIISFEDLVSQTAGIDKTDIKLLPADTNTFTSFKINF